MHPQRSNLRIFFFFIAIASTLSSCHREKYDPIPDVYVDFYIDLVSDPYFFDLTVPTNSVLVSSSTNNWGYRSAGYDQNGIIVYNASYGPGYEYFAYDRTCPHCFVTNSLSIPVNIDGIYAICPECNTNYALSSYGTPTEAGPSRYPLKNYKAVLYGQQLHVWNNRY